MRLFDAEDKEYFKRNREFREKYSHQFGNDEITRENIIKGNFSLEEKKTGLKLVEMQGNRDYSKVEQKSTQKHKKFEKEYDDSFLVDGSLVGEHEVKLENFDSKELLKKYFGYNEFRSGQKESVEAILLGFDVLGIMPTGSGKSICYQLPALVLDGISIVITPLISLMKDQIYLLKQDGILNHA